MTLGPVDAWPPKPGEGELVSFEDAPHPTNVISPHMDRTSAKDQWNKQSPVLRIILPPV